LGCRQQQDPAIVLTDVDPNPDRLQQDLCVLFCGMTRATVRLDVVCNAENPWVVNRLLPQTRAEDRRPRRARIGRLSVPWPSGPSPRTDRQYPHPAPEDREGAAGLRSEELGYHEPSPGKLAR
jgi:hypothetical protein